MCGIAGIAFADRERAVDPSVLTAMTRALAHRGPDGEGFWSAPGVGLGHRRLSIIDPEGGAQPISNEDGTVWVVFNGEIYNFQELMHALQQKGHRFKTRCDTEVIVHAYEEEGPAAFQRFRGMFSFALWDQKKQTLTLVRDPVGIKPMYYFVDHEKLLFSSEMKGLFRYPAFEKKLNVSALDSFFSFGVVPSPDTIYRDCRKLKPGHYVTYRAGKLDEFCYWDFASPSAKPVSFAEAAEEGRQRIQSAVASHLVSDVPVGILLSGGLDSSSIAAFLPKGPSPISSFNISFDDPRFDESAAAEASARQFGTRHFVHPVRVQPEEMIRKVVSIYDEPFADSSAIPTYLISKVAREHVKVVLSGDGGDENFGGYRRYVTDLFLSRLRGGVPAPLRKIIHRLGFVFPGRGGTALRELGLDAGEAYFHSVSLMKPEEKGLFYSPAFRAQLQGSPAREKFCKIFSQAPTKDPLAKMIYADMKTLLPDDYLAKVDRASMANGLEVRVPFLDLDLLTATFHLPASYKVRGNTTKVLLRHAMRGILPDPLIRRGKMGFEVPLHSWLKNELRPFVEQKILNSGGFLKEWIDGAELKKTWEAFLKDRYHNAQLFWMFLILELWHEK